MTESHPRFLFRAPRWKRLRRPPVVPTVGRAATALFASRGRIRRPLAAGRIQLAVAICLSCISCANDAPSVEPPSADSIEATVSWEDARQVVGQMATVVGRVEGVGHAKRLHFLDFHAARRDAFTVVIYDEHRELFSAPLEELFLHQRVQVRGLVSLYRGTPQIRVTTPSQIQVLPSPGQPAEPSRPAVRTSAVASDGFTVATFNVRNLFDDWDDPYSEDETSPTKPLEERERLGRTIHELDADILALQEVESRGCLEQFVDEFLPESGYRYVVHYEGNDRRGIDVALLSRFPVEQTISYRHAEFQDSQGRAQRFRRDLLRVTIQPPRGPSLEAWCVHLKSNVEGRESAAAVRRAEVQKIRTLYDQALQANPHARILLLGDLNDSLESESVAWLLASEQHPLQTLLQGLPAEQQVTYNRGVYRSMIDFILASPAMAVRWIPGSYRIYHGDPESIGSDHNPVVARFRWTSQNP